MQQKNFNAQNLNFWARLMIFFLSVGAFVGIKFPGDPTVLATDIVTTISTGGFISVISILAISVIMPVYNFIRSKPILSAAQILGSPNFWIYLLTFIFGTAVLFGIPIPEAAAEQIVAAIYEKDWIGLITIAAVNIVDPIIRWFRDQRNKEVIQG